MVNIQDKSVILSGGEDLDGARVAKVFSFNVGANKWEAEPELNQKRAKHASLAIGQKVYVACGKDGSSFLNSIEVMDLSESRGSSPGRSWKMINLQ